MQHKKFEFHPLMLTTALLSFALFLSGFLFYLAPLPLIYYHLRFQKRNDLGIACATVLLCGLYFINLKMLTFPTQVQKFLTPLENLPFLSLSKQIPFYKIVILGFLYAGIVPTLAHIIAHGYNKISPKKIFSYFSLRLVIVWMVLLLIPLATLWSDRGILMTQFEQGLQEGLQMNISALKSSGTNPKDIIDIQAITPILTEKIFYIIPFFILLTLVFSFIINLTLSKNFMLLVNPRMLIFDFTKFRVPFSGIWVTISFLASALILYKLGTLTPWVFPLVNVISIIFLIYFLQGWAVATHFLNHKGIFGFVRLLITFTMIIFLRYTIIVFIVLGYAEAWLEIREKKLPPKDS